MEVIVNNWLGEIPIINHCMLVHGGNITQPFLDDPYKLAIRRCASLIRPHHIEIQVSLVFLGLTRRLEKPSFLMDTNPAPTVGQWPGPADLQTYSQTGSHVWVS